MRILRSIGFSFLFICFFVPSASAQSVPQSDGSSSHAASFPFPQRNAQVLITVWKNEGGPVSGPSKNEMLVQVGGKPVEVEEIRSMADEPLLFSLLVDLSGSTNEFADKQIAAASKLFLALSKGSNHGYLVFFGDSVRTSDHFVDEQSAEQMLKPIPQGHRWGPTALYDAIVHACTHQLNSTTFPDNPRRAIFVFSDGGDNVSHHSLEETVKTAQREGIPIFSIGLSLQKSSETLRQRKRDFAILKALSQSTGGLVTFLDDSRVLGQLPNFLQGQNLLTFGPEALKSKKSYSLKIEPAAKNVHVWAQTEYVAP
jgi:hypothetical protein